MSCPEHKNRFWVESIPPGYGKCRECARIWCERYNSKLGNDDGDFWEGPDGYSYESDLDLS